MNPFSRSNFFLGLRAILLGVTVIAPCVQAQSYPVKPIKIIVPYTPAGGADITARTIAQKLSERLWQPVVIDNRPGAGGNIGHDLLAKSPPDGYTIMIAGLSLVTNGFLQDKLPYDPINDFAPISLAVTIPNVLAVYPGIAAKNVRELIALAKAKPGALNYASAGNGTSLHLAAELFKLLANVDLAHIPYKGSGQAEPDVISGQVELIFDPLASVLPHVKSGKLRALGISTAKRSAALPDVPTIAEAGVPGYEFAAWYGFFVPAKTPPEIITKLNREIVAILQLADVRAKLSSLGVEFVASTPQALTTQMRDDAAKWGKVLKKSAALSQN